MAPHLKRIRHWRKGLLLVAACALATAGATAAWPNPSHASAAAGAQTWGDDFSGAAGSAVDASKWTHETGGGGIGYSELEYYTGGTDNAALDGNGHLVITAKKDTGGHSCWYGTCQYTSAKFTSASTFTQKYGRFEARIKIPRGQGMWPAFWMLGNNIGSVGWPASGEIDVMENIGKEPGTVHGSLHGPGYSGSNPLTGSYTLPNGAAFADDYHTFTADWAPDSITFYVDGVQYEKHVPADTNGNAWVYDHPFYLILNLAVGGSWPGSPDASTSFPQQMLVDYVHVDAWDTGSGSGGGTATGATGAITGLAGKCVDVAAANSANGTAVQLYDCNGTNAQQWTIGSDGTIRALGKCLDVTAAGTADGTKVQLYDCNGTGAQKWTYSSGHDLVNPAANKCLDVTDNSSANGARLQIWTCTGGSNQKWTIPTSSTSPTSAPTSTAPASAGAMAAAPYLYEGWGNPPAPATVMSATGVKWFTMAFILSNGTCNPAWDGSRALTGGTDQSTINAIRGAGGDVVVSFGGWSGSKLGESCTSASALAGAYQKVISAYSLKAIDLDIEATEYSTTAVQQRIVDALKIVKASNPSLVTYITIGTGQSGPDTGLISKAAAAGVTIDGWTIMPFDFGGSGSNMGSLSTQAADGLKNSLKSAYGYTDDQAYRHSGISSMNGVTDNSETVTVADFSTMLSYARLHHLARFTFWSVNRDRPCSGGVSDSCSGVSQSDWAYTKVVAQYTG